MERDDLEWVSAIADARLAVAEELGWYVALGSAVIVGLILERWAGLIALYPTYYLVTLPYMKAASKAEDAYFRHAQIGRYFYLRNDKLPEESR